MALQQPTTKVDTAAQTARLFNAAAVAAPFQLRRDDAPDLFHLRDRDGAEVDIVVERGARHVADVEVKAAATVTESDFLGLRKRRAQEERRTWAYSLPQDECCAHYMFVGGQPLAGAFDPLAVGAELAGRA